MKNHGKVRSTIKPEEMIVDEYSVWVHSNINTIEENGSDEHDGFTGFEFTMIQYDKDEFIMMQSKKNSDLESQLTNTQLALTEVYEILNV